jgi:hypothetical protein
MRRLVLVSALAAAALAGCGRSTKPGGAVTPASVASVTVSDPRGDAVDAGGNPRRGRPDVDLVSVGISRNANVTTFQITAAAAPRGALRYEIFAQSPDVDGYDVVNVTRDRGALSGYVSFEGSPARTALTVPQALSAKGATLAINVPVDPIFGSTPFQWRVSLATASGAAISDDVPSRTGLETFPPK